MKKSLLTLFLVSLSMLSFSGCAKYYSTSSVETETFMIEREVPIRVEITKLGRSIVVNISEKKIREDVLKAIADNPIFVESNTSKRVLNLDIKHSNEDGGVEMGAAFLTGLSFYIIPSVADSVVDITISMDDVTSTYTGELVVAQGLGSGVFIRNDKYTTDSPTNLMQNLIKNALDKFTVEYMKRKNS